MKTLFATFLLCAVPAIAGDIKQQSAPEAPKPQVTQTAPGGLTPPANCDAPKTVPALMDALYKNLGGAAGRDTACLQALFVPGGRIVPIVTLRQKAPDGRESAIRPLTIEEFVDKVHQSTKDFYEKQTSSKIDKFGNIAQIFSQYEVREKPDGPVTLRGVNSVQAVYDGLQWHVLELLVQPESKANPMPAAF